MTRGVGRAVFVDAGHECLTAPKQKVSMRLLLLTLILFSSLQQSGASRIRLLLRDESDAGVAGATLNLRTENSQTLHLTTDANGVAVSNELAGKAVWLMSGQRADGTKLVADSYPADAGFRLVLIPGQVRDALLRLDGDHIVLDPDMIFSPGDPGEIAPPTPAQLAATVAPISTDVPPIAGVQSPNMPLGSHAAATPAEPTSGGSALWIVLAVAGVGVTLVALALLIGIARRRQT